MFRRWMPCIATLFASRPIQVAVLAGYYLAILAGLAALYGQADFSAPDFIYQGF
jgi:hypothetical protein